MHRYALTLLELAVVEQLIKGLSNKEIARHLGISPFTVREYLQRIGVKLGCHNRVEIVVHWLRVDG
ncbi:response regulator transcription factor [Verminephrobacter aporrectodeae]|uniref:response regulator transcription factor n=1 Tax=Verminephrobacter aporrectodeae TaxID=1110389 RepID=UPI0009DAC44E|nr:helix-turn-helix transcriptional regulator [Verminephrobacter aporrectodeae]